MPERESIIVSSTWKAHDNVELPEGMEVQEAVAIIDRGEFPEWLAEQIDASGADLTGWEVA